MTNCSTGEHCLGGERLPESALVLVIPGLLPIPPSIASKPGPKPVRAPALERLLARGQRIPAPGLDPERLLFGLFGLEAATDRTPPVAPLTYLADGGDPGDRWWVRADPVYLRPDRDRLLLFDASVLNVRQTEAHQLCAAFNEHFQVEGWTLQPLHPHRWYLELDSDPLLGTVAPERLSGNDIYEAMPAGPYVARWRTLLNETQMLFHALDVNEHRERAGELPVNAIWFWGAGRLPPRRSSPWTACWGMNPLARGLATLSGASTHPGLPSSIAVLAAQPQRVVVCAGRARDGFGATGKAAWERMVDALETSWLEPLLDAVSARRLGALVIYPGGSLGFYLDRRRLRRWWRRPRPLQSLGR